MTNVLHYRIISKIAEGGMGEVYLAEDTRLDRKVALKILPANVATDSARMTRFVQEAKAASALNHPNILIIHEIGQDGERRFIATEYVEGDTLRQRMSGPPMLLPEVLDIAMQLVGALAAAHEVGIVHRDIKPENIMIRRDGIVKVVDFGLAKPIDGSATGHDAATRTVVLTDPGSVVGTAVYMSPEQARGQQVDARTDIFSLGIVLYEMVAGCRPFGGATPSDAMAAILGDRDPHPLARYSRELPAEFQRIVSKALRRDRDRRYQTVKDLLLDLQSLKQHIDTTTGIHRPQGRWQRAAAVAVLSLALAATAGIGWYLSASRVGSTIDSIAVLPFANQNRDADAEYLADGLTESIINNLTQLPGLRVIARNSAFRYKGQETDQATVGKELGVRAVVVGRVLQRGQQLIVSAELVDVRDNKQLWGQHYSRQLSDVFALQEEMAREISDRLRLTLDRSERQQPGKRPTENLKAFQYYMQGRTLAQRRTHEDMLGAIRYYEQAIAEDRNYALAYGGLADANVVLGARGYISPLEGRRKAEAAGQKALALDERLAESHFAASQPFLMFAPYDFARGDRELRRAIELSPGLAMAYNYMGMSYSRQGRLDESEEAYRKTRELDPLSLVSARAAIIPILLKRDYARARDELRHTRDLGPPFIIPFEIGVYVQNRLFGEALEQLDDARKTRQNDPGLIYSTAAVYAAQGKRAEALRLAGELEAMSGPSLSQAHWIAKVHAALQDTESAFRWLNRGLDAGAIGDFFKDEPVWDPIRGDPRFAGLLTRMGIPGV